MRYREGNHSIAIRGVERNHSIAVGGSSKSDLSSIVFFNVQSISRSCWGCGSKFEGLLPDYVQKETQSGQWSAFHRWIIQGRPIL
ncbi:uncharacterized protein LOC112503263 isoform X1 [Cynara cardunculus var. scolymus]|uniref:uncharacterized protein LOC112503263 isoform X1 n=1 Tax=Cynara cardunculus var. scolymus TaxID=59895 RepID=UPI000D62414E|nr:uncharacterized protein LOC112503263 isoform X1 [Cynara cardunculus var. scolymus]